MEKRALWRSILRGCSACVRWRERLARQTSEVAREGHCNRVLCDGREMHDGKFDGLTGDVRDDGHGMRGETHNSYRSRHDDLSRHVAAGAADSADTESQNRNSLEF